MYLFGMLFEEKPKRFFLSDSSMRYGSFKSLNGFDFRLFANSEWLLTDSPESFSVTVATMVF